MSDAPLPFRYHGSFKPQPPTPVSADYARLGLLSEIEQLRAELTTLRCENRTLREQLARLAAHARVQADTEQALRMLGVEVGP